MSDDVLALSRTRVQSGEGLQRRAALFSRDRIMAVMQRAQLPVGVRLDGSTSVRQLHCRPFQQSRNASRIRTSAAAGHDTSPVDIERRGVLLAGACSLLAASIGARVDVWHGACVQKPLSDARRD